MCDHHSPSQIKEIRFTDDKAPKENAYLWEPAVLLTLTNGKTVTGNASKNYGTRPRFTGQTADGSFSIGIDNTRQIVITQKKTDEAPAKDVVTDRSTVKLDSGYTAVINIAT